MDKDKLSQIFSFESEIKPNGELSLPKKELETLRENGFDKVTVVLLGSAEDAADLSGLSRETFQKIKKIQSLPDSVVLDFLNSKGTLKD